MGLHRREAELVAVGSCSIGKIQPTVVARCTPACDCAGAVWRTDRFARARIEGESGGIGDNRSPSQLVWRS